MMVVGGLMLGALTNFGRAPKKGKLNLNKKKGFFGNFMSKIKGN